MYFLKFIILDFGYMTYIICNGELLPSRSSDNGIIFPPVESSERSNNDSFLQNLGHLNKF